MADVEKSTDCVVETLKSLPETMTSPALIQNPCNLNEIFIIGAKDMNNIYIYNQNTDTFKKNTNDNLTSILSPYPHSTIGKCSAFQCYKSNSIIVLGCFQCVHTVNIAFYSVFNSKSLTFDKVTTNVNVKHKDGKDIDSEKKINFSISRNVKAIYYTYATSDNIQRNGINCEMDTKCLPFWNNDSGFNVYKNYLIFSHECTVGIFDIKDEHNPKLIMYIYVPHHGGFHGLVIIPTISTISTINYKKNSKKNDHDIVKLLVFGGFGNKLLSSFVEYNIDFKELEIQSRKEKFGIVTHVVVDKDLDRKKNLDKLVLSKIIKETSSDELLKMLNFDQLKIEAQKKTFHVHDPNLEMEYGILGYNLYNSRYLMIYDMFGCDNLMPMNTMIIFDFQTKIWTIHTDIWPEKLWCKGHALIKSTYDGMLLQTMGGSHYDTYQATTSNLFIKLSAKLDWSIERLLWIAYFKNDKQLQYQLCPLATLPKDIILLVLKFFKKDFALN